MKNAYTDFDLPRLFQVEEVFNQWIQKQEDHEDVMALFE